MIQTTFYLFQPMLIIPIAPTLSFKRCGWRLLDPWLEFTLVVAFVLLLLMNCAWEFYSKLDSNLNLCGQFCNFKCHVPMVNPNENQIKSFCYPLKWLMLVWLCCNPQLFLIDAFSNTHLTFSWYESSFSSCWTTCWDISSNTS